MKTTHRLTEGILIAGAAITSSGIAAAQGAAADPWKMVPAATTSCFSYDGFSEKVDTARAAIQAEIDKQKTINDAARERFDNMDIAEKAQRMQAFMMKDPQAAMKMLQGEQTASAEGTAAVLEASESAKRLDAEPQSHQASFRAAIEAAARPLLAKQDQLIAAKTIEVGEAAISMFTDAADYAQYQRLIADENAAVEKACAPYFGPNGAFHKWLASYRTEVVEKMISVADESDIIGKQMAAMDLPGGGYRSTGPMEQTLNYIQKMRVVWDVRPVKSQPAVELKK